MPIYRIHTALVLFVHIPKCGGTSLETMLRAHPAFEGEVLYEMGPDNLFLAAGRCSPQHWHAPILRELLHLQRFDLIFTLVRDPVARLLSEHSMRCGRDPSAERNFSRWYAACRAAVERNPFHLDNHLRPAHEFLLKRAHIYNFNSGLAAIWNDLCAKIGIDPALSAPQHIRPCNGPRTTAEALPPHLLKRIRRDYGTDQALQEVLDRHWQERGQCWIRGGALRRQLRHASG